MGLIAALTIAVLPAVGAGENFYQAESWKGPTEDDLTTCATMAEELNITFDAMIRAGLNVDWQSKTATCEIRLAPDDDGEPLPASAAVKPARVTFTF